MAIETFSKKIKTLRQLKGLTLEDVGNAVGVGKSTVKKWENGAISNLGMDKILPLAKVLGITPIDLLNLTVEEPQEETYATAESTENNIPSPSVVGKNILLLRKQLGWTQEELARKMGYKSKSTINKIELGINDISHSKILQFAKVLKTTPAQLMGEIKTTNSATSNKMTFAQNLKKYMTLTNTSRNDLSEAIDVSYYTISDWINGKKYPRIDKIELLASYFGISKSALIEGDLDELAIELTPISVDSEESSFEAGAQAKVATFSERIRYAMAIKDVKQIDILNATGIDRGSLSSYVTGRYQPKQDKLHLIAKALNVSEIWLAGYDVAMDDSTFDSNITDSSEESRLTEGEKILVNLWRQISEPKQQMVLEMICIALKTNQ